MPCCLCTLLCGVLADSCDCSDTTKAHLGQVTQQHAHSACNLFLALMHHTCLLLVGLRGVQISHLMLWPMALYGPAYASRVMLTPADMFSGCPLGCSLYLVFNFGVMRDRCFSSCKQKAGWQGRHALTSADMCRCNHCCW